MVVVACALAVWFWPKAEHPNRCDCGHRRTTHDDDGKGYCLRSDCDCREFQSV